MKLLLLSTPVGALGSGLGGGVELTLNNIAQELLRRGHTLKIVAPEGSSLGKLPIIEIPGNLQTPAQIQNRCDPILIPANSVLANMWEYARQVQADFDIIVNFAYDWLPFYLTPFFQTPLAHFVSMASLSDAMDKIIESVAIKFPGSIAVCTRSQAETFPFASHCICLGMGSGIELSLYDFCPHPENQLAWVGRIAPEKGLEDAVAAAEITGIPLKIFGKIQDQNYWQQICQQYPNAPIEYRGFLPTFELQKQLRQCRAILMTPRWVEAFGNVAIEALACGVPVIAYQRGGPSEIVRDGETGFLVKPDSVDGLVQAITRLHTIERSRCRRQAEEEYSMEIWGNRVEEWLKNLLKPSSSPTCN